MNEYGHTEFIGNPLLNVKDKFALARSLGFRSMLEYNIAKQLKDKGVEFKYEGLTILYVKHELPLDIDEDYQTWATTNSGSVEARC